MKKSRLLGAVCACVFAIVSMSAHSAVIAIDPDTALIGESGPFGYGGRGVVFRAEENFSMTAFGMENSWSGTLDFSVDVYSVAGTNDRTFLSSTSHLNQTWDGTSFLTLAHNQSFIAGNVYEIIMRYEDPGVIFPHYEFDNSSLNPSFGFLAGTQMLILDGSDFDEALHTNYWLANFQVTVSPVPIPPALWLFGSGLLGLIGIARRKKA